MIWVFPEIHQKWHLHSGNLKTMVSLCSTAKEVQDAQPRADRRVQTGHQAVQGFTGSPCRAVVSTVFFLQTLVDVGYHQVTSFQGQGWFIPSGKPTKSY